VSTFWEIDKIIGFIFFCNAGSPLRSAPSDFSACSAPTITFKTTQN